MRFDPAKPFSTVHGVCAEYPGAKYEQNGFIYTVHQKCLNPKEGADSAEKDLVADATKKLLDKKASELSELVLKVVAAQAAVTKDGTAANKGILTKIRKKHDVLAEEIANIGG